MARAFIDLHCHTSASFDSTAKPADVARAAHARGLTHLVVSDHDRIDGALAARDAAPAGLTVIVGEEVKTTDGDLICAYLALGHPAGSVAGGDHRRRPRAGRPGRDPASVRPDARLAPAGRAHGTRWRRSSTGSRPTTPVSSATATTPPPSTRSSTDCPAWPSRTPIRCSRSASPRPPSTATRRRRPGCSRRCRRPSSSIGRATYLVRLWTPIAKGIQRARGNGRIRPGAPGSDAPGDTPDERPRWAGPSSDGARRSRAGRF